MKPVMNPKLVQWSLVTLGGILVAIGHIAGPITWQSVVAVIGAALGGGQLFQRAGDVAIAQLPKDVQDSVRPPANDSK